MGKIVLQKAAASELPQPKMYSNLKSVIEQKLTNNAPPDMVRGLLRSHGISPEEMDYGGVEQHLASTGPKVDKQALLRHVESNVPGVQTVRLSGKSTGFSDFKTPGIRNYKENLVQKTPAGWGDTTSQYGIMPVTMGYVGPHWNHNYVDKDYLNVVAHYRTGLTKDEEGNKVTHLDEIQSDWHQAGRSKGYRDPAKIDQFNREAIEANNARNVRVEQFKTNPDLRSDLIRRRVDRNYSADGIPRPYAHLAKEEYINGLLENFTSRLAAGGINRYDLGDDPEYASHWQRMKDAEMASAEESRKPPDAPFKKSWHKLALKHALADAVANGSKRLTWTTGDVQNERYGLEKHVHRLAWYEPEANDPHNGQGRLIASDHSGRLILDKHMHPSELGEHIGEGLATKLRTQEPENNGAGRPARFLDGLDLKTGGEGMRGFYDDILPKYAKKYGAKWGAQVGRTRIEAGTGYPDPHGDINTNFDNELRRIMPDVEALRQRVGDRPDLTEPVADALHRWHSQNDRVPMIQLARQHIPGAFPIEDMKKVSKQKKYQDSHYIEITPAMREAIQKEGQPMWGDRDAARKCLVLAFISKGVKAVTSMNPEEQAVNDFAYKKLLEHVVPQSDVTGDNTTKVQRKPSADKIGDNIANLDKAYRDHHISETEHPLASESHWNRYMSQVGGGADRIVAPPKVAIAYANDYRHMQRLIEHSSPEQIKAMLDGIQTSNEWGQALKEGQIKPADTGMAISNFALSAGTSPYPHEAAYLDLAHHGLKGIIEAHHKGGRGLENLAQQDAFHRDYLHMMHDSDARTRQVTSHLQAFTGNEPSPLKLELTRRSPETILSGGAGAGGASNSNRLGRSLVRWLTPLKDGPFRGTVPLDVLHNMMRSDMSVNDIRRQFHQLGGGLAIDNKILSFVLLAHGRPDTLVHDRVQLDHNWDGKHEYGDRNIYNGLSAPGKSSTGQDGLGNNVMGLGGLPMYEGMEAPLRRSARKAFDAAGIPVPQGSELGAWHWLSWLHHGESATSHPTVRATLENATGQRQGYAGVVSSEDRGDTYLSGLKYGYLPGEGKIFARFRSDDQNHPYLMTGSDMRAMQKELGADRETKREPIGRARIFAHKEPLMQEGTDENGRRRQMGWLETRSPEQRSALDQLISRYGRRSTPQENGYLENADPQGGNGPDTTGGIGRAATTGLFKGLACYQGAPVLCLISKATESEKEAPEFYSNLRRLIHHKLPNKAPADMVRGLARSHGIPAEESEYGDLEGYLGAHPTVNRDELEKHVSAGIPKIGYEKSEEFDGRNQTRYGAHTLPGGENYREHLLTLPSDGDGQYHENINRLQQAIDRIRLRPEGIVAGSPDEHRLEQLLDDMANARDNHEIDTRGQEFNHGHWPDTPNVLGHVRMNDRQTEDGKKALHLDELQSDWHQKGREEGYVPPVYRVTEADGTMHAGFPTYEGAARAIPGIEQATGLHGRLGVTTPHDSGVPDAPFKKEWHALLLKHALHEAVKGGRDRLTWTTGEQQNDRYNLGKHVSDLEYHPESGQLRAYATGDNEIPIQYVQPHDLHRHVGQEVADQLMAQEPEDGWYHLDMQGAQVGGQGMKGFYGSIDPNTGEQKHGILGNWMNDYAKKWGSRVGVSNVQTDPPHYDIINSNGDRLNHVLRLAYDPHLGILNIHHTDHDADTDWCQVHPSELHQWVGHDIAGQLQSSTNDGAGGHTLDISTTKSPSIISVSGKTEPVHSIDITPEMRHSILSEGQPLWGKRDVLKKSILILVTGLRKAGASYDGFGSVTAHAQISKALSPQAVALTAQLETKFATHKKYPEEISTPRRGSYWLLHNGNIYGSGNGGLIHADMTDRTDMPSDEGYTSNFQDAAHAIRISKGDNDIHSEMVHYPTSQQMEALRDINSTTPHSMSFTIQKPGGEPVGAYRSYTEFKNSGLKKSILMLVSKTVIKSIDEKQPWEMMQREWLRRRPLPPMIRIPDEGEYRALEADDGSIYHDPTQRDTNTHLLFADQIGLPRERIRGGGYIRNGDYNPCYLKEAERGAAAAKSREIYAHMDAVAQALRDGLPVPDHVRAQYPHLTGSDMRKSAVVLVNKAYAIKYEGSGTGGQAHVSDMNEPSNFAYSPRGIASITHYTNGGGSDIPGSNPNAWVTRTRTQRNLTPERLAHPAALGPSAVQLGIRPGMNAGSTWKPLPGLQEAHDYRTAEAGFNRNRPALALVQSSSTAHQQQPAAPPSVPGMPTPQVDQPAPVTASPGHKIGTAPAYYKGRRVWHVYGENGMPQTDPTTGQPKRYSQDLAEKQRQKLLDEWNMKQQAPAPSTAPEPVAAHTDSAPTNEADYNTALQGAMRLAASGSQGSALDLVGQHPNLSSAQRFELAQMVKEYAGIQGAGGKVGKSVIAFRR